MEDSRERIAYELAQALPGWPVTITYRNGTSKSDTMTLTAPFVGVGTDLRKLRGERRYAVVNAERMELGLIVIPFGIILFASAYPPDTKFTPDPGTARDA